MKIYTADEIRRVEEYEDKYGTPFIRLMENAGSACARQIERFIREKYVDEVSPQRTVRVCVVCGKGKNGGDGFVIARHLTEKGYSVKVVLAQGEPVADDAVEMYKKAQTVGVIINRYDREPTHCSGVIEAANVLIDCVFGIGFHGEPNEQAAAVFDSINEGSGYKISIDVPSGVNTDTGEAKDKCVHADMTLALTALKPAHVLSPAKKFCGNIEVLDIGISADAMESSPPTLTTLENYEIESMLPVRWESSHKNDFGHVLCIAGSMSMPGAACLCTKAALISGAGLVTAAFPKSAYPALASHAPEVMMCPVSEDDDGIISSDALPVLYKAMSKATVVVIGPGLGRSEAVKTVVTEIIKNSECPILLDADGLNAITENVGVLKMAKAPIVITPHPGEMSRLFGVPVSVIEQNRSKVAKEFADKFGVTVLLKGPATIVATSDTETKYINHTGNSGLAKGGSGDVLSGIIGALLAQGLSPFEAASLGAYMHGRAADLAVENRSKNSMLASDLYKGIEMLYAKYER